MLFWWVINDHGIYLICQLKSIISLKLFRNKTLNLYFDQESGFAIRGRCSRPSSWRTNYQCLWNFLSNIGYILLFLAIVLISALKWTKFWETMQLFFVLCLICSRYLIHFTFELRNYQFRFKGRKSLWRWLLFYIDILAADLPLPQVSHITYY